jgi:hypothetical protein
MTGILAYTEPLSIPVVGRRGNSGGADHLSPGDGKTVI